MLSGQFFSAHWQCTYTVLFVTNSCDYSALKSGKNVDYPSKVGTYTRVYVADRKHANYASRAECNGGGFANADDCTDNVDSGRVQVSHLRNVGSPAVPFITSVKSIDEPLTRDGTEYFWQGYRFCGWNVSDGSSRASCSPTSYAEVLTAYLDGQW